MNLIYDNIAELVSVAEAHSLPIFEVILENEIQLTQRTREEIYTMLANRYQIMTASSKKALTETKKETPTMITGLTATQYKYASQKDTICGQFLNTSMAYALSCSEVNASMGKICASPTAGSCGILPSVLLSLEEKYHLDENTICNGLLTASGIGAIITKHATVSGAEGGCQAECGVAAAMASAAAVTLLGGSPSTAAHAVSLTLMNCMGLVCDPIAGLVQVPCAQRNASQTINALLSADLALGGMKSIIPADEVIAAMYQVGKQLPTELKETALGGLATTPTGKKLQEVLLS